MQSPGCLGGPRSQSVPRDRYCLGTRLRRPLKGNSSSSKNEIAARDLLCRLSVSFHDRVLVSPHARDQRPQNERPTLADQNSRHQAMLSTSSTAVTGTPMPLRAARAAIVDLRVARNEAGRDVAVSYAPAPVECYGIRQTPAATLLETPVLVELSALSLSGRMDPKDSVSQGLVGEKGEAGTGVRRVAMQARTDLDRWLVTSHGVSLERSWLKASRCLPLALMIAIVRRA
ncbi:hypothetical protein CPLU01_05266 [Colletotrichum plurivorum]|uniref:Uncharacterized protein n=1 Tax=Colletotrichum plurivorum TaxID=2175906 RepID=A0A8H6NIQ7_9PEZI|nr:hypothetical protein CPLU01_05266 [Colletotrichum plurivorum]